MKPKGKINPALVAAVVLVLLTAGLGYALQSFAIGRPFVHASYDASLVLRGERRVDEVVIVYLDEASHKKLI